jgi:hypothetical protein
MIIERNKVRTITSGALFYEPRVRVLRNLPHDFNGLITKRLADSLGNQRFYTRRSKIRKNWFWCQLIRQLFVKHTFVKYR